MKFICILATPALIITLYITFISMNGLQTKSTVPNPIEVKPLILGALCNHSNEFLMFLQQMAC